MIEKNRRQCSRFALNKPIQILFGEQVTIQGMLKDISEKSAFLYNINSVFIQEGDKLQFQMCLSDNDPETSIRGEACVSRISPGEGTAIYFTNMEKPHSQRLQEYISQMKKV